MIVFRKPNSTDIRSRAAGLWVGVRWWLFGDWPSLYRRGDPPSGRKYADIYVSFFPGIPVLCLRYYNKSAWAGKLRDKKKRKDRHDET